MLSLSLIGDFAAATAYSAFALNFAFRLWRGAAISNQVSYVFLAALAASAAWAWSGPLETWGLASSAIRPALDLIRYSLWFRFIVLLLQPEANGQSTGGREWRGHVVAAGASIASSLVLMLFLHGAPPSAVSRPAAFAALGQAVVGLVLIEQLLRNVSEDQRWNAKPVCLGLGAIFVFDLFVYSQSALFSNFDGDALSIRAAVHGAALPLLFIASRRHADWLVRLHLSRAAVFHSATLLLVGGYLLLISALGYYVRYTGGDWGRAVQMAMVFVALLALAMLLQSGTLRARLRIYISKNFFSYRYDYRQEWLRFTAILASAASPQEMGETVVRALANLVESPSGELWLRRGNAGSNDEVFEQSACWNRPASSVRESASSPLCNFVRERAWIIDLRQAQSVAADSKQPELPDWLLANPRCWLLIPLLVGSELIGFVLLGSARAPVDLNWEVRDLLKTAASQASSYLAQMQATETLLEVRKFDAFNRMSAFVVHDLKNIVTQLSLMMKNAKRLRHNPEFQLDMLATVENSLEKMHQLMLQLREGERPHGLVSGVDLHLIATRLAAAAASKGRLLLLDLKAGISTRGHEERIERVLGHMVQNAFDASPTDSSVRLQLDRSGSQARVQIADQGCGMSDEFIRHRLFKPFQTTKASGMGLGAYESYQYLRELGGAINVQSQPDQGTTVTILLPLLHIEMAPALPMRKTG